MKTISPRHDDNNDGLNIPSERFVLLFLHGKEMSELVPAREIPIPYLCIISIKPFLGYMIIHDYLPRQDIR